MKKFLKVIKKIIKIAVIAIVIILALSLTVSRCNSCKNKEETAELRTKTKSTVAYSNTDAGIVPLLDTTSIDFHKSILTYSYKNFSGSAISASDNQNAFLFIQLLNLPDIEFTIEFVGKNIASGVVVVYLSSSEYKSYRFVNGHVTIPSGSYTNNSFLRLGAAEPNIEVDYDVNLYFYAGEYVPGYGQGLAAGIEQGKNEGYKEGYDEGYSNGYDEGYDDGYSDGYGEGYDNSNELKIYSTATTNNVTGLSWGNPNSTYSTVSAEGNALRISNRDYIRNQVYNEPYARWELPFSWEENREFVLKYDDLKSYYVDVDNNNLPIRIVNTLKVVIYDDQSRKVTEVYLGLNSPNSWEQSFKYNSTIKYVEFYSTCTYFDITNFQFGAYGGDEYDVGYDTGYNKGFNEGEAEGYDNGYDKGNAEGKQQGYTTGITEGKAQGYEQAIAEGVSQMGLFNGAVAFIKMFFGLTTQFLETKIAGDISLGLLVVGLPCAFMIVNLAIGLVKKFLGARGASEGDDDG